MKQHKLGQSELLVSPLTIGCWSFGGGQDSYWGRQEQVDVNQLVQTALDQGVNFFDTAFGYNDGRSEASLGQALAGRRQEAVICNKIPIQSYDELKQYDQTISDSLKRLQTDYVDLMMIHWPTKDQDLLQANLEAMQKQKEKGNIRYIGVSNFATQTLEIAHNMGIEIIADEFVYNLMSRGIERDVLPYCCDHNIGVVAYMPLMQGVLAGKYKRIDDIPPIRRRTIHFDQEHNPLVRHGGSGYETLLVRMLEQMRDLAIESGYAEDRLAIAWLMTKPGVSSVIAGCRNVKQLQDNAVSVETSLSSETVERLDEISEPLRQKMGNNLDIWQLGDNSRIW